MSRPLVIAHRGASADSVENSRDAFRLAVRQGADGVELDVHGTRDGILVVHHDAELPGLGAIGQLTYQNVLRHRLSNGETIPRLEEALELLHGVEVWVEVKTLAHEHVPTLRTVWRDSPMRDRLRVHSFDHRLIRRLGAEEPTLRTGILLVARLVNTRQAAQAASASAVWQVADMIDAALLTELRDASLDCVAWTVDEPKEQRRLTMLGVAAICTNHPAQALSLLNASG